MTTTQEALLESVRIQPVLNKDDLTALTIETATLEMERDKLIIERDEKIAAIAESYAGGIEKLNEQLEANTDRMEQWSNAHREDEFKKKKSIRVASHKLQFQQSPGKVEYKPGVKPAEALKAVQATPKKEDFKRFITVKPALNKDAITAAWKNSPEDQALIRSYGIVVVTPELFSFTPNREEMPDITIKSTN